MQKIISFAPLLLSFSLLAVKMGEDDRAGRSIPITISGHTFESVKTGQELLDFEEELKELEEKLQNETDERTRKVIEFKIQYTNKKISQMRCEIVSE